MRCRALHFIYVGLLLGAWPGAWAAQDEEDACAAGAGCVANEPEDVESLIQIKRKNAEMRVEVETAEGTAGVSKPKPTSPYPADRYDLAGKSVYLVMQDRFNRVNATIPENANCIHEQNWCGGTLKGITEKLPYIQGMGFDAIWITPVVKQSPLEDTAPADSKQDCGSGSGYSYHGYWAEDYYAIDPRYGTEDDLKELVAAVHKAGMVFILDIVMNHMRPIHQPTKGWEVEGISPFNESKYYHQLQPLDRPGGEDWDAYTELFCKWPSPMQALGAGTLCYLDISNNGTPDYINGGNYCNNYKGNPFGEMVYNNETYLGADAAGPRYLKYCGPGDYCEGYNQTRIWEGWFYDLGDLNHSQPFVRETQKSWVQMMHEKYDLDGIRLDTAPYMPWTFLKELQEAARPMQIIGEVTSDNISWHASFQQDPELGPVLAGMENFPPMYSATPGYCNDTGNVLSPVAMGDLRWLARTMKEQTTSGVYTDVGTLMNFMDNQDYPAVADYCKETATLIKNSLTWVMMSYGMPVITWGTEQGNTVSRNTMWTLGWSTTTWQYQFIKKLNWLRKRAKITKSSTKVITSQKNKLVFVRGGCKAGVWVFTNNLNTTGSVVYPKAPRNIVKGKTWLDALSGKPPRITKTGMLIAPSSDPMVLYLAGKKR